MSHLIPEDAQRLADRLRLLADEIESAARYGVPIPYCFTIDGHTHGGVSSSVEEHQFVAWAEYTEAKVHRDHHHGADWSDFHVRIGDGDRLPLRFSVRHETAVTA